MRVQVAQTCPCDVGEKLNKSFLCQNCFVNSAANVKRKKDCESYFFVSYITAVCFIFFPFCIVYKKHFILFFSNKDKIDIFLFFPHLPGYF